MQPPFVSVITLNYNQTDVTCAFLESTRAWTYPHYEILVCDMASAVNPTEKILAGNYPNTRLLLSNKNLGFAGGNNWGMRQAKGDYYFIVNNDTEVTPQLLEKLLEPFAKDGSIGVTCPKIMFFDQPEVIQYAGFNPMNHFTGRTTSIGIGEKDEGQHNEPRATFGAHGCAMMVKKEVVEKVGMSLEQVDWFVPHSANLRMIESICEKSGFPLERTLYSLEYYGNTSAATIPLSLDIAVKENKLKTGDTILMYGFGGGLVHAGLLVQW